MTRAIKPMFDYQALATHVAEVDAIRSTVEVLHRKMTSRITDIASIGFDMQATWFEDYDDQSTTRVYVVVKLTFFQQFLRRGEEQQIDLSGVLPQHQTTYTAQILGRTGASLSTETRGRELVGLLMATGILGSDLTHATTIIEQNADFPAALRILGNRKAEEVIDSFFVSALLFAQTSSVYSEPNVYFGFK